MRNVSLATLAVIAVLAVLLSEAASEPPSDGTAKLTGLKTRIETPRFEEGVAFYRDVLGLVVLESWDEGGDRGAILGLRDSVQSEAFLELAPTAEVVDHEGTSLQLRVSDVAAFARKLEGLWEVRGPEARPWGSTYLYLEDPAGVEVILYEGEL